VPKKKYSINWEDDLPVSFEVDGVQYASLEDIPEEKDRLKLEAMMDSSFDAEFDAEFAEMNKDIQQMNKVPFEKIILGIFTGIAVLMLLITGIASVNNVLKIGREQDAPGRVVDMIQRREYVNEQDRVQDRVVEEYYYPVVEYVSFDGKRHRVQMNEGSSSPSYEIGDEVVVLYQPERPLNARLKSFGSSALMWILPGITGILGIAFLVAVLAVRKYMLPEETTA
jgi:hypothetical protein